MFVNATYEKYEQKFGITPEGLRIPNICAIIGYIIIILQPGVPVSASEE